MSRYLESQAPRERSVIESILGKIKTLLRDRKIQAIDKAGLRALEEAEQEHGEAQDCIGEFKFASNQDMLAQIQRRRARVGSPATH